MVVTAVVLLVRVGRERFVVALVVVVCTVKVWIIS